jgi:hypothetical protein
MSVSPNPASPAAALLAAIALAATLPGPAAARPAPPAADWPAPPNSASAAGFSVLQMATTDAQGFVRTWNRPGPHADMRGETAVRPGQPIDTFIAFRGCRADPAGRCNVTAAFEVTGPDGKAQTTPVMEVWAGEPLPAPGLIYLSRRSLGLTFTPADRPGPYRIRAAVTDHVAGVTLHTQQVLTLSR